MSRVDEIRERLTRATPGPWDTRDSSALFGGGTNVYGPRPDEPDDLGERPRGPYKFPRWQDAEFIAHAPEDIAYLLAELEATEKRYQALVNAATSYAEATAVIIRSPDEMRQGPLNGQIDALNRLLAALAALEENPQT